MIFENCLCGVPLEAILGQNIKRFAIYVCSNSNNDRHLIICYSDNKLYEMTYFKQVQKNQYIDFFISNSKISRAIVYNNILDESIEILHELKNYSYNEFDMIIDNISSNIIFL